MAWVSEAVLTALDHYISNGGGSRGARAICSDKGTRCPEARTENLSRFRFVEEQEKDRQEKLIVSREGDTLKIHALPVDLTPEIQREFFEKGWGVYLIRVYPRILDFTGLGDSNFLFFKKSCGIIPNLRLKLMFT
jgi:hypothetical protein